MSLACGADLQKCGAQLCCSLSGWSLVEYVMLCHTFWWISYCFLILLTRQSEEWCCRLLTFVHGCIISFSAIRDILQNKESLCFQSSPLSETQKNYLSFMLSYFLFDFCWIHFFGNEPWVIYFHHLTSIIIILRVMVSNRGGGGISYAVAGLEITNPYLQLRWFLRTHGYLNTPIHAAVELWFFCLFSLIRTFGGLILFYYAAIVSQMDLGMKLSFTCIYGISLVLQWQIIAYFRKKYWIGNRRDMNVTTSGVSISQYFQRRTLDRRDYAISNCNDSETVYNTASRKSTEPPAEIPDASDAVDIPILLSEEGEKLSEKEFLKTASKSDVFEEKSLSNGVGVVESEKLSEKEFLKTPSKSDVFEEKSLSNNVGVEIEQEQIAE